MTRPEPIIEQPERVSDAMWVPSAYLIPAGPEQVDSWGNDGGDKPPFWCSLTAVVLIGLAVYLPYGALVAS